MRNLHYNLFYSVIQPQLVPDNLYDNVYKLWEEKQPYKRYTTNYNIELLDNENKLGKLYDFFIEQKSKISVLYFFYFLTFLSVSIIVKNPI